MVFFIFTQFIIEHYFITDFVVVGCYYSVFAGVVFINLRLIMMTY